MTDPRTSREKPPVELTRRQLDVLRIIAVCGEITLRRDVKGIGTWQGNQTTLRIYGQTMNGLLDRGLVLQKGDWQCSKFILTEPGILAITESEPRMTEEIKSVPQ